ncbi:hypothetical protein CHS0354_037669 [Potamilus streckersoni]|uniref:Major facilitator superfamily (MFS) profile domain-containing protein n=1 Tax=Potamilus streckersoni TaxID=2493646 RepID=A0AAE0W5N1_9BIVA|nr:hypothetical protein CHS0354_037669 [Potamilus streckersoni]
MTYLVETSDDYIVILPVTYLVETSDDYIVILPVTYLVETSDDYIVILPVTYLVETSDDYIVILHVTYLVETSDDCIVILHVTYLVETSDDCIVILPVTYLEYDESFDIVSLVPLPSVEINRTPYDYTCLSCTMTCCRSEPHINLVYRPTTIMAIPENLYTRTTLASRCTVPIIPEYLMNVEASELEHEVTQNNNSFTVKETGEVLVYVNESITGGSGNGTGSGTLAERILTIAMKARDENSEVGLLLSSKAFVQLVANPIVGVLCSRFGYAKMLVFGSLVLFVSAITFTFSETYTPLLVARALQGIASAATTIAGMSMIAERYPDDQERSRAMGTAMSGLAVGILVGYPFGGLLYAVFGKDIPFAVLASFVLINIVLVSVTVKEEIMKHIPFYYCNVGKRCGQG